MVRPVNMQSLLIATRNLGKVREIESILSDVGWSFSSLQAFTDIDTPEESGATYADNAILKARFYALATGMCSLADDSGLEVEALAGAPGVFSARYAGNDASDADRRALLLSELARTPNQNRRARFVSVVAISDAKGAVLNASEGICEGTIISSPRGDSGFGYDPLFVPDGYTQTFAELSDDIKNRISHRALALIKTRAFLSLLDHLQPDS
ncbi:MAG TPA: RdgB/HAM1 family non-canonical purine NTP pyrophosphatase [Anaerolineales bacterium]|nr:RdgB/HAM1 family non-canonical purine NTP pyrophosphatase [Anaerolineales bacterium]